MDPQGQQSPGNSPDSCPSPMVCRRRSAPSLPISTPESSSSPPSPPSPQKMSVHKTIDSLGLRIQTIESAVSTGSQADYFKPEQTIIIFDWDDTICPSTWIQANRHVLSFFRPVPEDEHYQKPLRELQAHAEAVLQQAMKIGTVVIITNAADPWVEISCRNFLPQLLPLMSKLPVIYARSLFYSSLESLVSSSGANSTATLPRRLTPMVGAATARSASQVPSGNNSQGSLALAGFCTTSSQFVRQRQDEMSPQRWKEFAFEQEIAGFYSRYTHQSWKNVVSIGDSIFERDATQQVVMNRPCAKKKCRAKTVKMFDDPTIEELIAQVRLIGDLLGALVQYDGDLNIEIDMGDLQEAGLLGTV
uniref:Uncharacterized protein n=1 Tax=Pyrodinium bahamense TaxID=73915 RepID=A0A7S0AU25_9DINO